MARAMIPFLGVAAIGVIAVAIPYSSVEPGAPAPATTSVVSEDLAKQRVVVLGIDGLDPDILLETIERFPDRTRNFQALIEQGGIHDLGTSCPPQSPVAWSNFITGRNPGGHGIFDFIHRDPMTRGGVTGSIKSEAGSVINLPGQWKLPIGGSSESNRSGEAFWVTLAKHGIPADVWRMPVNYPAEPAEGLSFSGMETPTLDGSNGTYTIYTTKPDLDEPGSGGRVEAVALDNGVIRDAFLYGPPNLFKDEEDFERINFPIYVDFESKAAAIEVGHEVLVLEPGEWSEFVPVTFSLLPWSMSDMTGIVRFYLRSIEPEFELYAAPVNIDPINPSGAVAEPAVAAVDLVDEIGYYYTQGMAEEVNALKWDSITDREFVDQPRLIYDQRVRMMDYALDRYLEKDGGFLFFYYSTVDLNCHMQWRYYDEGHPQHEKIAERAAQDSSDWSGREGSTWKEIVYDFYLMMDPVLGRVRERIDDDTLLVVMSDHGFETYRRKFGLNRWLYEKGYLVLKDGFEPEKPGERGTFQKVSIVEATDWSRTRAFGMGFNGLYLNLKDRELDNPETPEDESGIVLPEDADALLAEIKAQLEAEIDEGNRPILSADIAKDVYSGERLAEAPDIQIGYNAGYGNSDASSLGRITSYVYEDNMGGTFNGHHLMAPEVVPGILLTNGVVRPGEHSLVDLTVDILTRYGVKPGAGQDGHPVIE